MPFVCLCGKAEQFSISSKVTGENGNRYSILTDFFGSNTSAEAAEKLRSALKKSRRKELSPFTAGLAVLFTLKFLFF